MAERNPSIPDAVRRAITPLLICCDEIANIERTLAALLWAQRVVVIDSGSRDGTLAAISRTCPQAEVLHRPFDSFARQCNFGLSVIRSPWVLSLDADYVLSRDFLDSLARFNPEAPQAGWRVPLRYCIDGHPIRGSMLPPRICLYRPERARSRDDGHGHRVEIEGEVALFPAAILHDDRKPLDRWLASQQRYLRQERHKLLVTPPEELGRFDRWRRRGWLMPLLVLPYCLVLRGGLLDGWRGWYYAYQRLYAELLLSLLLMEASTEGTARMAESTQRTPSPGEPFPDSSRPRRRDQP
jgi:glycosyltransferase involved in cell wall biosynthesis